MSGKTPYTEKICGSVTNKNAGGDLKKIRVSVSDHIQEKYIKGAMKKK